MSWSYDATGAVRGPDRRADGRGRRDAATGRERIRPRGAALPPEDLRHVRPRPAGAQAAADAGVRAGRGGARRAVRREQGHPDEGVVQPGPGVRPGLAATGSRRPAVRPGPGRGRLRPPAAHGQAGWAPFPASHPDVGRFEILADGEVAGFTLYQLYGNEIVFTHTETDDRFKGHGLGSRLVRE